VDVRTAEEICPVAISIAGDAMAAPIIQAAMGLMQALIREAGARRG
jgi:hypothetical protein